MNDSKQPDTAAPAAADERPTYRSSAVAQLAGMPVATLRIWEQRYRAVAPAKAPTGHRQYSADDVDRVVLLRQLTLRGHGIGSLAVLTIAQLRELAATPSAAATAPKARAPVQPSALRMVVVGRALAQRLERSAATSAGLHAPTLISVFDSLSEAAQAVVPAGTAPPDVLVWQAPGLQADAWPELKAAQNHWRARRAAVAYRFAGAQARDTLIKNGASVVREPSDDGALAAWLGSFAVAEAAPANASAGAARTFEPWSLEALSAGNADAPARRFDDEALTTFAGLGSSMACECPSHVAELLIQIASFERYSANCAHRSPADAELHAYLQRVAGAARMLFETALERVATAEGLALP